jgi:hypothetical protein
MLARVNVADDPTEDGTVTPQCDRCEHLCVAVTAEATRERPNVLELACRE